MLFLDGCRSVGRGCRAVGGVDVLFGQGAEHPLRPRPWDNRTWCRRKGGNFRPKPAEAWTPERLSDKLLVSILPEKRSFLKILNEAALALLAGDLLPESRMLLFQVLDVFRDRRFQNLLHHLTGL